MKKLPIGILITALALVGVMSIITGPEAAVAQENLVTVEIESYYYGWDPGEIVVREGDRVRLVVGNNPDRLSEGLVEYPQGGQFPDHGLAITEFDVDTGNIGPHETVTVEFVADQAGEFTMYCSVWCGNGELQSGEQLGHRDQIATLRVLPAE